MNTCPYGCGSEVIIFEGRYFHKEPRCSGLGDGCKVTIEILDDEIYKRWIEKVGQPKESYQDMIHRLNKEAEEIKKHPFRNLWRWMRRK